MKFGTNQSLYRSSSFLLSSLLADVDRSRRSSHMGNLRRARVHRVSYPVRSIFRTGSRSIPSAKTITRSFDGTNWPSRAPRSTCGKKSRRAPLPGSPGHILSRTWPFRLTARAPNPTLNMHAHGPSSFAKPFASAMSVGMAFSRSAERATCGIVRDKHGWRGSRSW
jgi:hypothetical protein